MSISTSIQHVVHSETGQLPAANALLSELENPISFAIHGETEKFCIKYGQLHSGGEPAERPVLNDSGGGSAVTITSTSSKITIDVRDISDANLFIALSGHQLHPN